LWDVTQFQERIYVCFRCTCCLRLHLPSWRWREQVPLKH